MKIFEAVKVFENYSHLTLISLKFAHTIIDALWL